MRKSTYTKNGQTFPSKTAAPPIVVSGVTLTDGLDTLVVTLRLSEVKAASRFKNFCRQVDPIGFEAIDLDRAIYVVSGHPDRLESLIRQDFIRDWHHDVNVRVCRNDKELAMPKVPLSREVVTKVVTNVRSVDGEVLAVKSLDVVEIENSPKPAKPYLHGDEVLDKIEAKKLVEAEQWWKSRGLKAPTN